MIVFPLVARSSEPPHPPPDADVGLNATRSSSIQSPCDCREDLEVDTLRQMIADGMGQWEASRRLWGPEAPLVDAEATRAWVRAEFMRRFPWLRLEPV